MSKQLTDYFVDDETKTLISTFTAHQNSSDPHPNWTGIGGGGAIQAAIPVEFDGIDLFDGSTRLIDTPYTNGDKPMQLYITGTNPTLYGVDWSVLIEISDGTNWIPLQYHENKFDPSAWNGNQSPIATALIPPNWQYRVNITDLDTNPGGPAFTSANFSWYEMHLGADIGTSQGITRKPDLEEIYTSWGTSDITIPHTFGEKPVFVTASIVCTNPVHGYAVGEETFINGENPSADFSMLTWDNNNIYFQNTNNVVAVNKSTGTEFQVKNELTNWNLVVRAWFANGAPFYNVPVGTIMAFATDTEPNGYFECDGRSLVQENYPELFNVVGTTYGNGDTPGLTFNLPDLRGQFLRGWDNGAGIDPGRVIGSDQTDTVGVHDHIQLAPNYNATVAAQWPYTNLGAPYYYGGGTQDDPSFTTRVKAGDGMGDETRPTNVAVMFCIKYGEYVPEDVMADHVNATNPHPNMWGGITWVERTQPLSAFGTTGKNNVTFSHGLSNIPEAAEIWLKKNDTTGKNHGYLPGDYVKPYPGGSASSQDALFITSMDNNAVYASGYVGTIQISTKGSNPASVYNINLSTADEVQEWDVVVRIPKNGSAIEGIGAPHAEYVVPAGWSSETKYTYNHGLGETPILWKITARCISAEWGYFPGDEVAIDNHNIPGNAYHWNWPIGAVSSTQLIITTATNDWGLEGVSTVDANTGHNRNLSPAKWELVMRAWTAGNKEVLPPSEKAIGFNQAYTDMQVAPFNYVKGVAYQNTTGRPVEAHISIIDNMTIEVSNDGVNWILLWGASADRGPWSGIIPPGTWYRCNGGSGQPGVWVELR